MDDSDIEKIELILTGKNDSGKKLSILELDDYSEFNGYMNQIEDAYNALNEKAICISDEWSSICQE